MANTPGNTRSNDQQAAVLVADASKVTLVAARKLLEPLFSVYLAEDGEAAWSLIESVPEISAVFTDQTLPGLDGIGLLQRIRDAEPARISGLPVIITTSGDRNEEKRRLALDAGATDFILKPFDPVDLVTRARAWSNSARDASGLRADNLALRTLVTIDPDTRLGNRDYFLDETIKDRCFCLRHGSDHSLLYISIDNHERILREQGKVAAREAVALVADAIRSKCRREDTFARVADAEFALSLLQTPALGARVLAERIRQAIALKIFKPRGMTVTLTVSIGVALPPRDQDLTAAQMLDSAERACQKASRAGGNQTCVPPEVMARNGTTAAPAAIVPTLSAPVPAELAEDPQAFVDQLVPQLAHLDEQLRLQLIDRLLVMAES